MFKNRYRPAGLAIFLFLVLILASAWVGVSLSNAGASDLVVVAVVTIVILGDLEKQMATSFAEAAGTYAAIRRRCTCGP